eukprot:scaffold15540_cov134-Isochrysis_galbana.AAC.4
MEKTADATSNRYRGCVYCVVGVVLSLARVLCLLGLPGFGAPAVGRGASCALNAHCNALALLGAGEPRVGGWALLNWVVALFRALLKVVGVAYKPTHEPRLYELALALRICTEYSSASALPLPLCCTLLPCLRRP